MVDPVQAGKARLRILLIAPHISKSATGEGFVAYKWAEALSARVDLTVLALQSPRHSPLAEQLPLARVVTWPDPQLFHRFPRFRAMFKPEWPVFARHVRRYLAAHRGQFDLAHQIMPQAMRYASPLRHGDAPYIIGPLGGALDTPPAFAAEMGAAPFFTRLRGLDKGRLRFDPGLRRSYAGAAAILGVAPYVRDAMAGIAIQRFETVLELGVEGVAPDRPARAGHDIRLLHVGRGIRTKGLRDVIRALALLPDRPEITLTSAGAGAEIALCQAEAARLGVAHRVQFLGLLPRDQVEDLYRSHDIFAFPSFREPAGNVLYEAMRWGLPVIAANRGGPASFVDESCGIKVQADSPDQLARDLAAVIRQLADDAALRARLGAGGKAKLLAEGLWPVKADRLVQLYRDILG